MSVNNFGTIFRFITPIMIVIFGWIGSAYLNNLDKHFERMDNKFDTFMEKVAKADKRLDKLEYVVFDAKDYQRRTASN